MTYANAIAAGYQTGKTSYQRGYVSRKINPDNQPVLTSRGKLYVLLPCWHTTQYCIRQYLITA